MPALALLELSSIAVGIRVGDAMVKRSPVRQLLAGTVHPGKYLVLVSGDVASVEEALDAGREAAAMTLLDEVFLPHPHPDVTAAVRGTRQGGTGAALGVVELRTAASLLAAADRAVKGADVTLREMHLADALGGKSYCLFAGDVADVETAVELAVDGLARPDLLVEQVVIPQLHDEMDANLVAAPRFATRLGEE
jgi:microcompartment protein CcmL/EutN